MADKSAIEWTDATWNPIVGCSIVSPGCINCYAMKMAGRIEAMGGAKHYAAFLQPDLQHSGVSAMTARLTELTASIVQAYVSNNPLPANALPDLIDSVDSAVRKLAGEPASQQPAALVPAVNPKKSIFPDHIICLDDGKRFKSLKRHLAALGMTADDYRAKWGLDPSYPMVAPNYSRKRSALAKASGLGRAGSHHMVQ